MLKKHQITINSKPKELKLWQKRLLFGLGLIILFLSINIYLFRTNLFKAIIEPKIPFQVSNHPNAPDYNIANNWALKPEIIGQKTPIFFIHPTTYYNGSDGWNADINFPESSKILNEIAIPNHGAPFTHIGEVWAPKYRQAALFATLSFRDDTWEALNLAYQDIDKSFDLFISQYPKGTKFIIAGVNQGALHGLRLLQTKIANKELEKDLIAAYLIDQALPKSLLETTNGKNALGKLKPCQKLKQSNCIISYINVDDNDERELFIVRKRSPYWDYNGYKPLNKATNICVNPLNGGKNEIANPEDNKGSAAASYLEIGVKPALLPSETGAVCANGFLIIDNHRPSALSDSLFELGAFYKTKKYNLFYDALENDCKTRIKIANGN